MTPENITKIRYPQDNKTTERVLREVGVCWWGRIITWSYLIM
jgi:hypothetical protein